MDLKVGLLIVLEHSAEIFESPAIAVDIRVLPLNQEVSQVEVLLHVESDVDRSNRKKKACLVLFHHLHEGSVSF
jgi:hypothetical protein